MGVGHRRPDWQDLVCEKQDEEGRGILSGGGVKRSDRQSGSSLLIFPFGLGSLSLVL